MGRITTPPIVMSPPIFSARSTICYHIMILGPIHASNSCHTKHHEAKDMSTMKSRIMSKISTKHILYKNVWSSCTTPMYINHVHQHHASHVHLPICQPCASTNIPTMCIYWYSKHVHLPICQPCVISLMICLHHEPSTITMYQTNTNCCANQVIPTT